MDLVAKAARFAAKSHAGQFRKYPNPLGITEPYIMHPARVVGMIANANELFIGEIFSDSMSAAWLHDVVEDCEIRIGYISDHFGYAIGNIVKQLTNPSKGIKGSREYKKRLDREHISQGSRSAKLIKAFDRMDNIQGIVNAPKDFALMYLDESELLAEVLRDADRDVFNALAFTINAAKKYLTQSDSDLELSVGGNR